jgi:hypothetical protein
VFPAAATMPNILEIAPEAPINTVWLFPKINVDIAQSALPYANAPAIPASMYMKIYLRIPTALSAYPPRYANVSMLNAR